MLDSYSRILLDDLHGTVDPAAYVRSVGLDPFKWQEEALQPGLKRLILLSARQSGKSTVIAGRALSKAKYLGESLILIICPSKDQSKNLMKKIDLYMSHDRELAGMLIHDATFEKEFRNGSRIVALPGSERSVRSYSGPRMIIIDEAARVLDETYKAARPMMVGAKTELILMSTPFGKRGFFYEEWTEGKRWTKIDVRVHLVPHGNELVKAMPEKKFRKIKAAEGISGYYSPRHREDVEFLQDEFYDSTMGPYWFEQEYCNAFKDPEGSFFSYEDILAAETEDVTPLLMPEEQTVDDGVEPLEV